MSGQLYSILNALECRRPASDTALAPSAGVREVHHRLRTALTSIMGFAELIESENLAGRGSAMQREFANNILASSHSILELLEQ